MGLIDLRKPVLFFTILINHFTKNSKRSHNSKNRARLLTRTFSSSSKYDEDNSQKFKTLAQRPPDHLRDSAAVVFDVEAALLKSSSLFPYFMLVAFEAGGLLRALLLLIAYPLLITLCSRDFSLKAMVMICFSGLKKDSFREGRSVLPKFFLEDVAAESFEVLRGAETTVAVTDLPLVMVESFLKDYLGTNHVVARDLRVVSGRFLGTMEEKSRKTPEIVACSDVNAVALIGGSSSSCFSSSHSRWLFSNCKELYRVSEQERRNWNHLPRKSYPKPIIFHDGRLAFRPTYAASLAMFLWLPLGLFLCLVRAVVASSLPVKIMGPLLRFTGLRVKVSKAHNHRRTKKGNLYVCNHKTLLDPYSSPTPWR